MFRFLSVPVSALLISVPALSFAEPSGGAAHHAWRALAHMPSVADYGSGHHAWRAKALAAGVDDNGSSHHAWKAANHAGAETLHLARRNPDASGEGVTLLSASTGGKLRAVRIDGIPVLMEETRIRAAIASGALMIVYPGTLTPVPANAGACYPPQWF